MFVLLALKTILAASCSVLAVTDSSSIEARTGLSSIKPLVKHDLCQFILRETILEIEEFFKPKQDLKSLLKRLFVENLSNLTDAPYDYTDAHRIYHMLSSGADQPVEDVTQWPYSCVAKLIIQTAEVYGYGSGVMVGPHHVLTAAHNVYTKVRKDDKMVDSWTTHIRVCPAFNGSEVPFGEAEVVRVYAFEEWVNQDFDQTEAQTLDNLDLALLVINKSLGHSTGWLSMQEASGDSAEITCVGYPIDKCHGHVMYQIKATGQRKGESNLIYNGHTFRGQSGGPLLNDAHPSSVVGIHTFWDNDDQTWGESKQGGGKRLLRKQIDFFQHCIRDTWHMTEPRCSKAVSFPVKQTSSLNPEISIPPKILKHLKMGWCQQRGYGVQRDIAEAKKSYQKAASKAFTSALKGLGNIYYSEGLKLKYQNEDRAATIQFEKAVEYYEQAANKNSAPAMKCLGDCYYAGYGVPYNLDDAIRWYTRSHICGNAAAAQGLGDCFEARRCAAFKKEQYEAVSEYCNQSKGLYEESANMGNAQAMLCLGNWYRRHAHYDDAIKYYQNSSRLGNAEARRCLGDVYCFGLGVTVDLIKALQFYKRAACMGNAEALKNIGSLCDDPQKRKQFIHSIGDLETIEGLELRDAWQVSKEQYYTEAAKLGDTDAMRLLGDMHLEKSDYANALKYYVESSSKGNAAAFKGLGDLYSALNNPNLAFKNYMKAAVFGHNVAVKKVGDCCRTGFGITKSLKEAIHYYQEAYRFGNPEAKQCELLCNQELESV